MPHTKLWGRINPLIGPTGASRPQHGLDGGDPQVLKPLGELSELCPRPFQILAGFLKGLVIGGFRIWAPEVPWLSLSGLVCTGV
eukprot:1161132-Pelagomonas_calceolata.AAC.6